MADRLKKLLLKLKVNSVFSDSIEVRLQFAAKGIESVVFKQLPVSSKLHYITTIINPEIIDLAEDQLAVFRSVRAHKLKHAAIIIFVIILLIW